MKLTFKKIIVSLSLLLNSICFAGTIQNEDVKSLTELTNAGGSMSQLINDSKIYVTANSLNEQLSTAIINGDVGGSGAINYIGNFKGSQGTTNWSQCNETKTFTVTIASPAVFTSSSSHGFAVGQALTFSTTGALPTGLTANTTYYVSAIPSGTTYRVSATLGGSDVNTSGTQSGTHTQYPVTPISCSSGSFSGLAFTTSTSSPLRFSTNFVLTQTNSTKVQGQGLRYDFTIANADQAKVLSIQFDYNASSTFVAASGQVGSDSDLEVYMYDVTNSVLLPVSPKVITANGSNNFNFKGTFQTSSNSTSYRLIIYAGTTNANATGWTFKFINVQVGPQPIVQGPPIQDWQSYNLVVGAVTTPPTPATGSTQQAFYRRVGDSLEIEFYYRQTSATGANDGSGVYLFPIPTGLTIDTTKYVANTSGNGSVGSGNGGGGNPGNLSFNVSIYNTTNLALSNATNGTQISNAQLLYTGAAQSNINFYARVPIVGWSSTTQMSQDTDTRVVDAFVWLTNALSGITSGTSIKFDTILKDSHSAYSVSSGIYTIPVSGDYLLSAAFQTTSGGVGMVLYKNGSQVNIFGSVTTSGVIGTGTVIVPCIAGDQLFLTGNSTASYASSTSSSKLNSWSISRISGPSAINATESVNARYFATSTSISGSLATISWTTKDFDSHNGMSSGVYTIQTPGKYQVSSCIALTAASSAAGNAVDMQLQKNGTVVSEVAPVYQTTQTVLPVCISDEISALAGDLIRIQVSSAATTPSITSSNSKNYFSIFRTGN